MAHKLHNQKISLKNIFKPTVGKLLGLLMAAYFVFTFFQVRDQTTVNYYEVEEGSLVKQSAYTGLILREEEIVNAGAGGYIYYYIPDGRKVASGDPVYAIDEGGDLKNMLSSLSGESVQDSAKIKEIRSDLMEGSRTFSNSDFSKLYSITDSAEAGILEYTSLSIFSNISRELKDQGISFSEFMAEKSGTVCSYTDGYEDVNEENISASLFEDALSYEKQTIKAGELVSEGSPAYKLIIGENWQIAFPLDESSLEELNEKSNITVSFAEKGFSVKVPIRYIYASDGSAFGILDMTSYQVQFTSDRFIEFDIVTNNVSGLKVPDKSITTKDFYIIPIEYLSYDERDNSGFYKAVVGEDGTTGQFVITDIYSTDEEYCYIECDESSGLAVSDYVMMEDDETELYQIGPVKALTGVYNINKGYTVFRKVEILESANGYSIVKKNTAYGISTYDHIVLDTSTVSDDQLLYR